jgi:glutaredoxin/glutathione-dependent peroxiredoxin
MTISVGDTLPDAVVLVKAGDKVEAVSMADKLKGRKVVIFGLPGAFTSTCTAAHVPSFIRTKPKFDAKGVDEIICLAVNDPHVMKAWGLSTGATAAGITMVGDVNSAFTKAIGMEYSAPAAGFIDRSKRYALYAEDGVVKVLNHGQETGACEISGGETLLEMI